MVRTIEIENEKTIEILYTIESIERVNKTITRNKDSGMTTLYIQQWEDIKTDLLRQLKSLLSEMNIMVDLKTAAYPLSIFSRKPSFTNKITMFKQLVVLITIICFGLQPLQAQLTANELKAKINEA